MSVICSRCRGCRWLPPTDLLEEVEPRFPEIWCLYELPAGYRMSMPDKYFRLNALIWELVTKQADTTDGHGNRQGQDHLFELVWNMQ